MDMYSRSIALAEGPCPKPSRFDGQQNPCQIKIWIHEIETSCSFKHCDNNSNA